MLPLDDEGVAYALVALRKIDIIIETSKFSGIFISHCTFWYKNVCISQRNLTSLPLVLERITHQGQIL